MTSNQELNNAPRNWIAPAGQSAASQADGELKMSAVILTLAEPLLKKEGMNAERQQAIIALTVAAWNKAMLPLEKQAPIETEIINHLVPHDGSAESAAVVIEIMDAVDERRRELFPNLRAVVANYDFRVSESGMTLNIGSAPIRSVH